MLWHTTHTHSEHPYVVHELLFPGEQPSVPADVPDSRNLELPASDRVDELDVRAQSECVGQDIRCDDHGFWKRIVDVVPDTSWGVQVDAGPIEHRGPLSPSPSSSLCPC